MTTRPLRWLLLCLGVSLALVAGGCGSDDDDGANVGGKCAFLGEFAGTGFDDAFDPSAAFSEGGSIDFGELYEPLAKQFREVADAAPSDIEDALQTMADAFDTLASELDGFTLDFSDPANIDPEAMAAFEKAGTVFEDSDFDAASNEIEAWLEANCDIDAG